MFLCKIRNIRRIMTTNTKLTKVMEDLQNNPYFNKYADKISQMQKTNPEEFMEKIERKHQEIEEKKKELENPTKFVLRKFIKYSFQYITMIYYP